MTRDEIRRMAREAGIDWHKHWNDDESNRLEVFAALRAAAEREACVQEIREVRECIWDGIDEVIKDTARNVCDNLIIRIRARGEK